MRSYWVYMCFMVMVVFLTAEAYLRLTGRYATYSETIGGKYNSYYNAVYHTWHLVRYAGREFTPANSDFHYEYSVNDLGVRERNFEREKKDSTIRIFVTGDSFSEGQGAPYDSTWPHLLARYLSKDGINAEVLNTGVAGSDPVYNYVLHRDILKGFKSDYVLVSINSSDVTDYMMRGGFERFHPDTTTHYKKGPWYEPVYHYSFFARGVIEYAGGFHYRGIFSNEKDFFEGADKAVQCYSSVIDSFVNLTRPDSTRVIVVLFSTPSEIRYDTPGNKKDTPGLYLSGAAA